jgi:ClpP class serine protease
VTSDQPDRDARAWQETQARRDAYTAGGDLTIVHNHGTGVGQPRAPGLPRRRVWGDVPARNPGFTGRDALLASVRAALLDDDRAVVMVLHGMGGVVHPAGEIPLPREFLS